jgi:hypothetical protein
MFARKATGLSKWSIIWFTIQPYEQTLAQEAETKKICFMKIKIRNARTTTDASSTRRTEPPARLAG